MHAKDRDLYAKEPNFACNFLPVLSDTDHLSYTSTTSAGLETYNYPCLWPG